MTNAALVVMSLAAVVLAGPLMIIGRRQDGEWVDEPRPRD